MSQRMLQRRGTASQWTSANTVLAAGEFGVETDTGQFKIGDGTTEWTSLPYFKDTIDLNIDAKAPINSPTFTGNVVLPTNTVIGSVSSSEIAVLDGITATTAELNTLDGITASTNELNILDGVTADASEINRLDGLLASTAELNTLIGITASSAELNILDGATLSTSELNTLDGITATTTELNYVDGVTSSIQTQLDSKAPVNSPTFTGTVSGITKSMVGLSNVDNTSDANKPISSATQSALNAKLDIAGGTMTGALTLSGAPTQDLHAATKAYVDNVSAGLNFHPPVRVATTANITLSGTQTIDGVSVAAGDRVLVKDQTNQTQNGIYVVASGAWSRATDADNSPTGEIAGGDFTFVLNGTVNAGFGYVCSNTSAITVGTTNITYAPFNAGQTVTAGTGLTEPTPGTLTVDSSVVQYRVSGVSDTEIGYLDGVTSPIQTQLAARVAAADYSAKGVILVGTGNGTYVAQTIGSNGQVLTANSAQADGVEWTTINALPTQTGNSGRFLTTDGSSATWAVPTLNQISTVSVSSATTNDVLFFNGTNWVNRYVAAIPFIINAQTATSYTLVAGDAGDIVEVNNSSPITVTIPTNASVPFPIGTQITLLQTGPGQITVAGPSGGTLNATPGTKLRAQWSSATLLKRATDTWVLMGDLTA